MNNEKIEIKKSKEIKLVISDGYFYTLNLTDYIKCNQKVIELFNSYDIRAVNIWGTISDCGLEEIDKRIQYLHFIDKQAKINLDKLYNFKNLLKIVWDYTQNLKIDYSQFPLLEELHTTWNKHISYKAAHNLKFLFLRSYNSDVLIQDLPQNIEILELHRGKLKNLHGIQSAKRVRWLEIQYFPNLESLDGIDQLNDLKFISLHNCGKKINIEYLSNIESLEAIRLLGFNEIETLKPLQKLPNLKSLIVDSGCKILDGDKSLLNLKGDVSHLYNYKSINQRLYKEL